MRILAGCSVIRHPTRLRLSIVLSGDGRACIINPLIRVWRRGLTMSVPDRLCRSDHFSGRWKLNNSSSSQSIRQWLLLNVVVDFWTATVPSLHSTGGSPCCPCWMVHPNEWASSHMFPFHPPFDPSQPSLLPSGSPATDQRSRSYSNP